MLYNSELPAYDLGEPLGAPTLGAAFRRTLTRVADRIAFTGAGEGPDISWTEYDRRVRAAAAALTHLGLRRGDTLALLLTNRSDFFWLDCAAAHLGVVTTSFYTTAPAEFLRYVTKDSGATVLVTEAAFADLAEQLRSVVRHVVSVDGGIDGPTWGEVVAASPDLDFDAAWRAVDEDDVAVLIYTSGTTGQPKGVELTHAGVMHMLRALVDRLKMEPFAHQLSFLPMAHAMARFFDHYMQVVLGYTITSCADPRQVGAFLPQTRPSVLASTPRLWEKLRDGMLGVLEAEPDEARRAQTTAALQVGLNRVRAEQESYRTGGTIPVELVEQHQAVLPLLVALRGKLGLDRMKAGVVGGAPVDKDLIEFYHAIGISLGEAYGFTESSAGVTGSPYGQVKFGSVGPPLAGVTVTIADDGEILVKSVCMMKGYRNLPEQTAAMYDADGWFLSGDLGSVDSDGYVYITGRKKDLIINAAGKNMSPTYIEGKLIDACKVLEHAVAIGDRRPYNVAILVLNDETVQNAFGPSPTPSAQRPEVLEAVEKSVHEANTHLARVEQIKKYRILDATWVPGGDELTPTMKLRRSKVTEKYRREIDELYGS